MKRGYAAIAVTQIIKDRNFGGVLRAAHCYGASMVVLGGKYKREFTDTTKAYRHIPLIQNVDIMSAIPFDCVPVAVDLLPDAEPLPDFIHPQRAFYIFGAENQTLGKRITDKCKHKVFIPTQYCMNLAATANVVLYDRMAKLHSKSVKDDSNE